MATRADRFSETNALAGNKFLSLKREREAARKLNADDGYVPRSLHEAVNLVGTCLDMCPEYEREEREYQNNVDKLEMIPGTRRIDPIKAVKAYHRPAAGNEVPPPSDIRPPHILKRTLDYLFHTILAQDPLLEQAHPFLRDRTRAVRQDFTIQNEKAAIAIECNERIARFHIYCLFAMRARPTFSESQELEQLRKVLQSLTQFYDDARHSSLQCPNEAEFRAYYLLTHLRDPEAVRQAELLPSAIFEDAQVQLAIRLQSLVQKNNTTAASGARGRPHNAEACLNAFTRFFKLVASPACSFLMACLLQPEFDEIRSAGLKAMRRGFLDRHAGFPIDVLSRMLGCDDVEDCADLCRQCALTVLINEMTDEATEVVLNRAVAFEDFNKVTATARPPSQRLVGSKRGNVAIESIIDGSARPHLPAPSLKIKVSPTISKKIISPKIKTSPVFSSLNKFSSSLPSSSGSPLAISGSQNSIKLPTPSPSMTQGGPSSTLSLPTESRSPSPFFFSSTSALPPSSDRKLPSPLAAETFTPASLPSPQASTSKLSIAPAVSPKISPKSTSALKLKQVDVIAKKMADKLLKDFVQSAIQKMAANAIAQVQQDNVMREIERQETLMMDFASRMADQVLQQEIALIAVAQLSNRRLCRRALKVWLRHLDKRKSKRQHWDEKLRRVRKATASLTDFRRKPSVEPSTQSLSELDVSHLSLTNMDLDEVTVSAMSERTAEVESFWTPGTLLEGLRKWMPSRKSDILSILVFTSDSEGTEAKWLKCKLGFADVFKHSLDIHLDSARVTIGFIDPTSLLDADLSDVGLLIFNAALSEDEIHTAKGLRQLEVLKNRASQESSTLPNLLLIFWPTSEVGDEQRVPQSQIDSFRDISSDFVASATIVMNEDHIEQNFLKVIPSLIRTCAPNTSRLPVITLKDCLQPFLDVWQAQMEELAELPTFAKNAIQQSSAAIDTLLELVIKISRTSAATVDVSNGLSTRIVLPSSSLQESLLQRGKQMNFAANLMNQLLLAIDTLPAANCFTFFCDTLVKHLSSVTAIRIKPTQMLDSTIQNSLPDFENHLEIILHPKETSSKLVKSKKRPISTEIIGEKGSSKKFKPLADDSDWFPMEMIELQSSIQAAKQMLTV